MKENKKITLFLPSLRGGGAEKVFLNLSKGFLPARPQPDSDEKKGFLVDLVLVEKVGAYVSSVPSGVKVVSLNSKRVFLSLFPLIKYLKKERPDVLISAMPHVNIVALLAKILAGSDVDIIATEHNPPSIDQKRVSFLKRFVTKLFIKTLYGYAKAVVAVSHGVAEDFKKTFGYSNKNLRVIYNPIDIRDIQGKAKQQTTYKRQHAVGNKCKVILGVGRLTPQKDFEMLIRAFKKLTTYNLQLTAKLLILGEGEERGKLEKLAKDLGLGDDVSIPGFVDNPYLYMAKADVFVLSSVFEGFGNVIVEAMACGTPIVSTDCPGGPAEILCANSKSEYRNSKQIKNFKPEIIDKEKITTTSYGKLVPVRDVKAMADAISETLKNPINPQTLRERAKDFSVENAVKKYFEIINT